MITGNDIKIWTSEKSLYEQIDELSFGEYSLKDPVKWENQRKKITNEYVTGKITIKEYTLKAHQLIENVLSNIVKNEIFGEGELPF